MGWSGSPVHSGTTCGNRILRLIAQKVRDMIYATNYGQPVAVGETLPSFPIRRLASEPLVIIVSAVVFAPRKAGKY